MERKALYLAFCLSLTLLLGSASAACSTNLGGTENFRTCSNLPQLNAVLAWTYEASKGSIRMAFRAKPDTPVGWVCWGINPVQPAMAGTRSLIAFRQANGSVAILTYNITEENKGIPPDPSPIEYKVSDISAVYNSNGEITMFATWKLLTNDSTINHVWQTGAEVKGMAPQKHGFKPANLQSLGKLNLASGAAVASASTPHQVLKNIHGILNAVSWGIMLPLGIMFPRHIKVFESADPAWFYLHASCQTIGYIIGVAGWATGMKLGSYSKGVVYHKHRSIGITVFVLGTLQVFALLLRPTRDNKYRVYWNYYHYLCGYGSVVLGIYNIFKGFDMLHPDKKWKHAYVGVLIAIGVVFALLEVMYWAIRCQRRSRNGKGHDI